MDYGDDWPPAPEPEPPARRRWSPRRKCAVWTLVYALIAVFGLLGLHVRQQYAPPFDPHDPPAAASSSHHHAAPPYQKAVTGHR